jgi:hypothetical protein
MSSFDICCGYPVLFVGVADAAGMRAWTAHRFHTLAVDWFRKGACLLSRLPPAQDAPVPGRLRAFTTHYRNKENFLRSHFCHLTGWKTACHATVFEGGEYVHAAESAINKEMDTAEK